MQNNAKRVHQQNCSLAANCYPMAGIGLAAIVVSLDQISKWLVLNYFLVPRQALSVTSFLNIILAWNKGVSFGLLSSDTSYGPWILATIAFVFTIILALWIWRTETKMMALSFGMILGGALGNLSDRLRFGAVTDFLDFHVYGYHWYTFNVADTAIVLGVACILLANARELWSKK